MTQVSKDKDPIKESTVVWGVYSRVTHTNPAPKAPKPGKDAFKALVQALYPK